MTDVSAWVHVDVHLGDIQPVLTIDHVLGAVRVVRVDGEVRVVPAAEDDESVVGGRPGEGPPLDVPRRRRRGEVEAVDGDAAQRHGRQLRHVARLASARRRRQYN